MRTEPLQIKQQMLTCFSKGKVKEAERIINLNNDTVPSRLEKALSWSHRFSTLNLCSSLTILVQQ